MQGLCLPSTCPIDESIAAMLLDVLLIVYRAIVALLGV